jgi:hypothetical protein
MARARIAKLDRVKIPFGKLATVANPFPDLASRRRGTALPVVSQQSN